MERTCEVAARNFIRIHTDNIRSIRMDSTGVDGDDSLPVKRTREVFTKLQGITVLDIFEAGFDEGRKEM